MPPGCLIEMPPESNVTALPTIPSSGPRAPSGLVPQHDQRGVLRAALGDGAEGAHPEARDLLAPGDVQRQARDRRDDLGRAVGQRGRREVVRRAVLQVARGVLRLGDRRGAGGRRPDVVMGAEDQPLELRGLVLLVAPGLEPVEPVRGEQRALDDAGDDVVADVMRDLPAEGPRRPSPPRAPGRAWAASRARSASNAARSPSPTRIQRRPSARASARCRNVVRASPASSSAPQDAALDVVRDALLGEDADGDGVGPGGGRRGGGGGHVHAANPMIRRPSASLTRPHVPEKPH